jgi:hypothetical protein
MRAKQILAACVLLAMLAIYGLGGWQATLRQPPNHNAINSGEKSSTQASNEIARPQGTDERIASYTGWLAVFTCALVVISGCQIYFLTRADKTARISADAAKDAAEAMRRSVTVSADTAKRQLRAYVNVATASVYDPADPERRKVAIEIKNFGHTPAHKNIIWVSVTVREYPLEKDTLQKELPGNVRSASESLPAGRTSVIEVSVPPQSGWAEARIREGTGAIYASGQITYTDVFGDDQVTKFRLCCWGEGFPRGRMTADAEGNTAT